MRKVRLRPPEVVDSIAAAEKLLGLGRAGAPLGRRVAPARLLRRLRWPERPLERGPQAPWVDSPEPRCPAEPAPRPHRPQHPRPGDRAHHEGCACGRCTWAALCDLLSVQELVLAVRPDPSTAAGAAAASKEVMSNKCVEVGLALVKAFDAIGAIRAWEQPRQSMQRALPELQEALGAGPAYECAMDRCMRGRRWRKTTAWKGR